jgi:hypothetical protein
MKKHIDPKQVLALDDWQQAELKRLWKPQKGDFYYRKDMAFIGVMVNGDVPEVAYLLGSDALPLLSIGQMIEILGDSHEVADVLWEIIVEEKLSRAL